jgi:hypothetical protein
LTLRDTTSSADEPKVAVTKSKRAEPPSSPPSGRPPIVSVSHPPKPTTATIPVKPTVVGVVVDPKGPLVTLETPPEPRAKADPQVEQVEAGPKPSTPPEVSKAAEATRSKAGEKPDAEAGLEITDARFCRRVHGFGSVDSLAAGETLKPGQSIVLYAELGGVQYNRAETGFKSRIASRLELFRADDPAAEPIWTETPRDAEYRCRDRSPDYYLNYVIPLPKTIEPGKYRLRLLATDLVSNHIASSDVPLAIAR